MGRKSEYAKTIGKIAYKIAPDFIPFIAEDKFYENAGKYKLPLTIISGSARLLGLVLGFTEDPRAFLAYAVPTTAYVPALARDEIFKK